MLKNKYLNNKPIISLAQVENTLNIKKYLYTINYTVYEEDLCKLEMKYLFKKMPKTKYLLSNHYIPPVRSAFIKQCISIIYTGETIDDITRLIESNNISFERFKVCFIDIKDDHISFKERRAAENSIGFFINGNADIHKPEVLFAITRVNGRWIFGTLEENKSEWKMHNHKPFSYCNALDVRVARALVNIAAGTNMKASLVDPCCGIGTVVIEALSLGIDIEGFELNPLIAENAKENVKYFGYKDVIENTDMHNINKHYDAAIVDLPYGVFSLTSLDQQRKIIETSRKLAAKVLFITYANMDSVIKSFGFSIVDSCPISKNNFTRYLTVCI